MAGYAIVVEKLTAPAVLVHGGAGSYLTTTSAPQRAKRGRAMAEAARLGQAACVAEGGREAVLRAAETLEKHPGFNAGYGSRLQQDGRARLSAAIMDGARTRLSAVYNVQGCLHPSRLAASLLEEGDRNLDGEGAAQRMIELGTPRADVRSPHALSRWRKLVHTGDRADREGAIGEAGEEAVDQARAAAIPIPDDLEGRRDLPDPRDRHGTIGAVALDGEGGLWACTSTGGRGHETVGRISDSPTPAGNYACPVVALSATGFGEQILDLNLCGRIATRMLDGATLEAALRRTFDEVVAAGGLLGVIAIAADGTTGYAYTTEACGAAWCDAAGAQHVDEHSRSA